MNDSCSACGASVGVSRGVVGNGNGTENDSFVDAGLCHGLWETYYDSVCVGEINAMYKNNIIRLTTIRFSAKKNKKTQAVLIHRKLKAWSTRLLQIN